MTEELTPNEQEILEILQNSWMEKYKLYLESDEWKHRRILVLERDNYLCQSCHEPANEVHHLTYAHVGNELLSELTSLCKSCHKAITHISRLKPTHIGEKVFNDGFIWKSLRYYYDVDLISNETLFELAMSALTKKYLRNRQSIELETITKFLIGMDY